MQLSSSSSSSSSSKKRKRPKNNKKKNISSSSSNPLFSAISQLESEDAKASKVRRTLSQKAAAKSQAARSQADLHGEFVECRILLQKALSSQCWKKQLQSNHLPPQTNNHDNNHDENNNCNSACDTLLSHFLEARRRLCLSDLDQENNDNNNVSTDDEDSQQHDLSKNKYYKLLMKTTTSSSDSESEEEGADQLESKLQKEYELCKHQWKEVLNRRHNNLRLHSGLAAKSGSKFRVVDQSFWDQFQSNISHERLMHLQKQSNNTTTTTSDDDHVSFDDSKLYQHILKDFISLGAARHNGGSAAAEAAADRLRKAMKKKKGPNATNNVDTKASKGRKIRYVVHEKLTNFAFPVNRPVPPIHEDDWFRSLFGGAANRQTV